MSQVVSTFPRGQLFTRSMILKGIGITCESDALAKASARWGAYQGAAVTKAAVATLTTDDFGDTAANEFFDLVRERSLLGRLTGLRQVPFRVKMLSMADGTTGYWTAEGASRPLSKPSLQGSALSPLKLTVTIVETEEAITSAGRAAEIALQRDMERALIDAMDAAFIDAANAGVPGEKPAAVTFGAPSVASTGSSADAMRSDIANLFELFDGDLSSAFAITDARTAVQMGLMANSGNLVSADVGARGGSLLGVPLLVTRGSPRDSNGGQIALLDASAIAFGLDGFLMKRTMDATLAMSDTPESEGVLFSLWQLNLVGFGAEIPANWQVQRDGSVALLTDVAWGA
ncbi:Phage capsid family protein [compost metagenome]